METNKIFVLFDVLFDFSTHIDTRNSIQKMFQSFFQSIKEKRWKRHDTGLVILASTRLFRRKEKRFSRTKMKKSTKAKRIAC